MAAEKVRGHLPALAGAVMACGIGVVLAVASTITAIIVTGSLVLAGVLAVAFWGAACEAAARGDDIREQPDIADTLAGLTVRTGYLIAR